MGDAISKDTCMVLYAIYDNDETRAEVVNSRDRDLKCKLLPTCRCYLCHCIDGDVYFQDWYLKCKGVVDGTILAPGFAWRGSDGQVVTAGEGAAKAMESIIPGSDEEVWKQVSDLAVNNYYFKLWRRMKEYDDSGFKIHTLEQDLLEYLILTRKYHSLTFGYSSDEQEGGAMSFGGHHTVRIDRNRSLRWDIQERMAHSKKIKLSRWKDRSYVDSWGVHHINTRSKREEINKLL